MKRYTSLQKTVLFVTLIALAIDTKAESPSSPQETNMFGNFWSIAEVIHKIETKAFRRIPLHTIIEEGLRSMANKVDAHSAFFSPQLYQDTVEFASGQFPGIGVSIISKETDADSLLVVDAIRGGPADTAGIKSGDSIIKVNGEKLRGLTSDEVINKLKGPIDTTLYVTVLRDKKPLKFKLTRKLIQDRSVYAYHFPAQRITYIALKSFSHKTQSHIEKFITTSQDKDDTGIILDIRKNPGGVLDAAVKTAGVFLPEKSAVTHTKNNKQQTTSSTFTNGKPFYSGTIPLIVITDNFTASSAEILTGCLKHHAALLNLPIFIIGMPTFGKGSVQEIIPLQNGGAIKLTTLLYYLPNDQCIQAIGVKPDIMVKPKAVPTHELKWIEDLYGKEVALSNHITREEVEGKPPKPKSPPLPATENKKTLDIEKDFIKSITNDYVIQTALTLANVWHLGKKSEPETMKTHEGSLAFMKKMVVTEAPECTACR